MKNKKVISIFLLLLLIAYPTSARTRQKGVENFLDQLRISVNGYSNTPNAEINVSTNALALEVSSLLNINVNNTLDILLFYQKSQNSDGGFGRYPLKNSTWEDTINAVQGLKYLDNEVNRTQIKNWKISNYLNNTAKTILYTNVTRNNQTIIVPMNITNVIAQKWYEFISSSFQIGFYPNIESEFIIQQLQSKQYANGTYPDLMTAVESIHLLTLLNSQPRDPDLASKYIRAYIQENGAFSFEHIGTPSINATFFAVRALYELNDINEIDTKNELLLFVLNQQVTNSGFHENGQKAATLKNTWKAIMILFFLNSLKELLSPDVIQTEGFIPVDLLGVISATLFVTLLRRFKHE